ncbi:MAG: FeoA family protein [bacterium]
MKAVLKSGASAARMPLAELPVGLRARLCSPAPGSAIPSRLGDLGFVPGTTLSVVRRAPLGDPVEIDIRGYRLCLRLAQIDVVFVEPADGESDS